MYTVNNSTALIDGSQGKYDGHVNNNSVRYGRNAINNYYDYILKYKMEPITCDTFECAETPELKNHRIVDFEAYQRYIDALNKNIKAVEKYLKKLVKQSDEMPPINFELQYMPESAPGEVDRKALIGASYEEMNQRLSMSISEMNKKLNSSGSEYEITAEAMDLNKDNYIDVGEYATSILLSDMLSTDSKELNLKNINGKITNEGENKVLAYGLLKNKDIAYKTYLSLYMAYDLGRAVKDFKSDINNLTEVVEYDD